MVDGSIGRACAESRDSLQALFDEVDIVAPRVGRTVKITQGKHKGIVGVVFWHGEDRYSTAGRYGSDIQLCLRDARGRDGFRIGVRAKDGSKVFCCADYAIVATG